MPILRADKAHTVRSLTGRLLESHRLGMADTGFPVLIKEVVGDGEGRQFGALRVVGFLGMDEVEHALCGFSHSVSVSRQVDIRDLCADDCRNCEAAVEEC